MLARARVVLLALLALIWWFPSQAQGQAPNKAKAARKQQQQLAETIRYRLSIPAPTTRYVHVQVEVERAKGRETTLAMPAWTPGSYLIRDFGKHVYDVEAQTLDGRSLAVTRIDKQRWTIANAGAGFRVNYRVFADELSVRTSYVDDAFALLNGAGLFMYLDGETARAAELELITPAGWTAHTALDPAPLPVPDGAGQRFTAPNYDELIDSPVLFGAPQVRRFTVDGKSLELVFAAPAGSNADLDRIAADAERIVRSFARTLNGLPFERYSFLLIADEAGGGGLEHHNSAAMIVQPWIFASELGYARLQRLMAHEFFHLWNVKRIHDAALGPFDYSQESYTDLLWFHEGLTETMETRALLRAGLVSADDYLSELAAAWTAYRRKPGRNAASIASLSREAWIKTYKPEANHGETTISYYEKGNLIGVCLDLSLRLRGRGSLDGLFRRLWAQRDPTSGRAAITGDDVIAAASAEAGEDMRWFFDRYVYGTEELPLPALLEQAGFVVSSAKLGAHDPRARVWSGMSGRATVSQIEPDSPAAAAGLMLGDELIAVDEVRVGSVSEANERLADRGVGATVQVSLFRRSRLETRTLTTGENPHRRWGVARPEQPGDPELARLRELWLLEHLRR